MEVLKTLDTATDKEEIVNIFDKYLEDHPIPQESEKYSVEELYPELNLKDVSDDNVTINIQEYLNEKQKTEPQNTFEFEKNGKKTLVYIDNTGQYIISSIYTPQSNNSSSLINPFAKAATTKTKSTSNDMLIANSYGATMVRLWETATFSYDGSKVSATLKDGGIEKKSAGSSSTIVSKGEGKVRNYSLTDAGKVYKYCEVYTGAYIESSVPFKFGGIVLYSGTFEVYSGSNVTGSIYGGAVKK